MNGIKKKNKKKGNARVTARTGKFMKKKLLSLLLAGFMTAAAAPALLTAACPAAGAAAGQTQVFAAEKSTYTVTANLLVPGELNTQLPGVTAYMTNGNNPLGEGGYAAKAPTEPVSNNASVTLGSDGSLTLSLPVPNPVFTLQKIGSCSNATITHAAKDSKVYSTSDGSVSRTGRITKLTITLKDRSGTYIFNDCTEFPTLLGVDWHVPLTLNVDLSGVPQAAAGGSNGSSATNGSSAGSAGAATGSGSDSGSTAAQHATSNVNYDSLKAIVKTVHSVMDDVKVSEDGKDVAPNSVWVTKSELAALEKAYETAQAALTVKEQSAVDAQTAALQKAYKTFTDAQKSGKGESTEHLGKTLKPGKYTISANIWFNKADTGLPLNPHITNGTFPPMNPVEGNAELTIAKDGSAQVVIPVCIKDRVMTIRDIKGLKLLDVKKLDDGAISEITVDLGKLSGDSTVVTQQGESMTADIWMGDLAMTISGLSKEHTWPYTFELNLSGVDTTDGGKMPTVELEMMDSSAAESVMAAAGVDSDALDMSADSADADNAADAESANSANAIIAAVLLAVVLAAIAAAFVVKKRRGGK